VLRKEGSTIEMMIDLPDHVLGLKATGEVTAEEYTSARRETIIERSAGSPSSPETGFSP
jgi:hypothetical protein